MLLVSPRMVVQKEVDEELAEVVHNTFVGVAAHVVVVDRHVG